MDIREVETLTRYRVVVVKPGPLVSHLSGEELLKVEAAKGGIPLGIFEWATQKAMKEASAVLVKAKDGYVTLRVADGLSIPRLIDEPRDVRKVRRVRSDTGTGQYAATTLGLPAA